MKLFLFGLGPFAAELLRKIDSNSDYEVLGVNPITPRTSTSKAPRRLNLDILAQTAKELGIPLFESDNINEPEFVSTIKDLKCDLLLNWGHHQLFKKPILNSSQIGCLNNHPGLLPYGRGSGSVYGEMINNKRIVGQTLHLMSEDFDLGKIVHQRVFSLRGDEYQSEIKEIFDDGIIDFFLEGIEKLRTKSPVYEVSDFGTYYPRKSEGDEIIHWDNSSDELVKKIRGRSPNMPSITFLAKDWKEIFIWRVSPSDIEDYSSIVGQVLYKDNKKGILVKTNDNAIWIEEISEEPKGERCIPKYPIGTVFVSNWIFEISRIRKELNELKNKIN
tara:strand:+ start:2524 stop:3516 length:993 start_codon:yes stop_codon:yes gene_type:complete